MRSCAPRFHTDRRDDQLPRAISCSLSRRSPAPSFFRVYVTIRAPASEPGHRVCVFQGRLTHVRVEELRGLRAAAFLRGQLAVRTTVSLGRVSAASSCCGAWSGGAFGFSRNGDLGPVDVSYLDGR